MTPPAGYEPAPLRLTTAAGPHAGSVHVAVHGFLDYDSSEHFLDLATSHLDAAPGLRTLYLNCADLTGIDSMGLAMLLMLHRRTTAAGVALHLENRPPLLDRLLTVTGTLDHLVPATGGEQVRHDTPPPSGHPSGATTRPPGYSP
ncbi:STAS domain-containing protein [Streptomyces sp. NPDC060194]|uniref:STAS domain-containing protein n=1 Tax=Streptomyces sp. NPDC060194 TaxID=3347069 RepID=UPI003650A38F